MQDWKQTGYWSGGDDPWDKPPESRRKRKPGRRDPEAHSPQPDHEIGSCDEDYRGRPKPASPSKAAPPKQPFSPPKRPGRGARLITYLIMVVIVIIAAAAVIFAAFFNRMGYRFVFGSGADSEEAQQVEDTQNSDDFSVDIDPEESESEAKESAGPSNMQRITPDGSLTLELNSSAGLPELSYQEIYAQLAPSVVNVMTYGSTSGSYATGIILSENGYILTNQHVVSGFDSAEIITADNTSYEALLVGEDANTDLALLKVDAQGLTPASFGRSDELTVGDECFAIGNPLSIRYRSTFSNGIISALDRSVEVNGYSMTLLQTTAALNSGNSGGPLINIYGQVIGINNMKIMSSETTVEGLGFAIPSVTAQRVINALAAEGEVGHPVIGITCYSVSASGENGAGADGLYVATIASNSDAALQGLQVGDIITAIDGQPVRQVSDVNLASRQVGDTITASVWRDGETLEIPFQLSEQNDLNL